jgi:nucleoid-associated protein YgaU
MYRTSITRYATNNVAIRAILCGMALLTMAAAVLSVDKVLRRGAGGNTPASEVLSPPASDAGRTAKAVENAADTLTAPGGVAGGESRRDADDGLPVFDVARIEPSGDTVIAGRATPGATIELLRNGNVYDRVVADASGQFVIMPPRLPAGDSELSLRSQPLSGAPVTSKQTVVVSVQPNLRDQAVAALMTPDQPSVVLSRPGTPDASTGSVAVETVEAEAGGRKVFVTGHAAPGALVRLYLNDAYQATATADDNGRVAFTATCSSSRRDYQVRLDEVDWATGVTKSRAEVPFRAPPSSSKVAQGQTMVVSRGDSLWRISRLAYGDGSRYTVIYDANQQQIRNPDRIYPGQVFRIPGK